MAGVPKTHATVADLEEFNYVPESRDARRRAHYLRLMEDVFRVFEREGLGTCDVREVGTIVRAVGLNPSEAQVLQIVEAVEEPESTGFVKLSRVQSVLLGILMTRQFKGKIMVRDSEEMIYRAFEALDKDKKGYVEGEYYKEMLSTLGDKFTAEEMLEALNAAADPETGNIYYEDFAPVLASE